MANNGWAFGSRYWSSIRRLLVWAMVWAVATHAGAQRSLVGHDWLIRHGDDRTWSTVPVDDSWMPINIGVSWARQNHASGNVWLRTTVVLGKEFEADGLRLVAELRGESAEIFLNGTSVVQVTAAVPSATFDLPRDLVRWGDINSLAVRIQGHPWTGGWVGDSIRIEPRGESGSAFRIAAQLETADHVFGRSQSIVIGLAADLQGSETPVELAASVVSDFQELVATRRFRLGSQEPRCTWQLPPLPPGFYQVIVRGAHGAFRAQAVEWLAVEPTALSCEVTPMPERNGYWSDALAELEQLPDDFRVEFDSERSTPKHDVYSIEMAGVQGVTLRGWFVVPSDATGALPAVLQLPGYSAAMQPEWFMHDDDVIYLVLDIRGHGRSTGEINPGFGVPGLVGHGVLEPERYVYRGAFMDCGRALQFLASRPEVDQSRIAVSGMSQGGGLALATAALFPDRVAACVAGVPFLGDFRHHIQILRLYEDEMRTYVRPEEGETDWGRVLKSMDLINPAALAERIKAPLLMGVGLLDDDCPPHIAFSVFNRVQSQKEFRVYPQAPHSLGAPWNDDSRRWLRQVLRVNGG